MNRRSKVNRLKIARESDSEREKGSFEIERDGQNLFIKYFFYISLKGFPGKPQYLFQGNRIKILN